MAPSHVEAQLTAHRVESMGAGLTLRGSLTEGQITHALEKLLGNAAFKTPAAQFAERYRDFDPGRAADDIVEDIETLLRQPKRGA